MQESLAQITWYHNLTLLEKLTSRQERLWYAQQTIENGWSRNILVHQIESRLHERQGNVQSNFAHTLPSPQSDPAQNLLKDPYNFDFLTLGREAEERDIERGLVTHIRDFLLELGVGFSFVGSQYPLDVAGQDWFLDMLFYHLKLRCYVVVELKATDFKPEYAGKMQFYLLYWDKKWQAARRQLNRSPHWNQVVDLLLNRMVNDQTLSAPDVQVKDEHPDDLEALLTEAVLVRDNRRLSFFHETFFDYAFARRFVGQGKHLLPFLLDQEQHLFLRSIVRQILTHERADDFSRYLADVRAVLESPDVRFCQKR